MSKGWTEAGRINDNGQRNDGLTDRPSNHHNQKIYAMTCTHCGHRYGANGSDIWLRRCPRCQRGAPSSEAR